MLAEAVFIVKTDFAALGGGQKPVPAAVHLTPTGVAARALLDERLRHVAPGTAPMATPAVWNPETRVPLLGQAPRVVAPPGAAIPPRARDDPRLGQGPVSRTEVSIPVAPSVHGLVNNYLHFVRLSKHMIQPSKARGIVAIVDLE